MFEKIPSPNGNIEKIKEKEEKRKETRKILPADLQLNFIQERPEKEKWFFEGELLKRKHSKIDEDKLFFESLKEAKSKDIEGIKEIQEKIKEKREKISENLFLILTVRKTIKRCLDEKQPEIAGNMAIALNDLELAKKSLEKCFDQRCWWSAGKIALALNDLKTAKKAMEMCLYEGIPQPAAEIALALNDLESARKAMEICFNIGWAGLASEIALKLNDLESARKAMEMYFDKRDPYLAAKIALALKDRESARKAMEMCFENKWLGAAAEIALDLNDLESARKAMEMCFENKWLGTAAEIALALNDLKSARKAMEMCFDLGQLDVAVKIAFGLNDLEVLRKLIEKCFDKRRPDLAGEIAIALNDLELARKAKDICFLNKTPELAIKIAIWLAKNDPQSAKEVMKMYFDQGLPNLAGKIVIALNDLKLAREAIEKCFDEEKPEVAAGIALGLNDFEAVGRAIEMCLNKKWIFILPQIVLDVSKKFQVLPETKRLLEKMNQMKLGTYEEEIIVRLLSENQDLGLLKTKYLPQYLFIKKFANEMNQKMDERKKWKNPEEFFEKHAEDIARLHSIDLNLSTHFLKNQISRGLSFAHAYLDLFKPLLTNREIVRSIKEYIASNKNLDGQNFSDLLEISSAYQKIGEREFLVEILNQSRGKDFKKLKLELNKSLLKKLAEKLKIKAEISEQDIKEWKLKYLANLLSNKEMLKEENLEIFNSILKAAFEGRFEDFISNPDQNDEIGRQIALHNKKVEKEFKERGVNWENWLNFKGVEIVTVGTKKKQEREALFEQFEIRLNDWVKKVDPSLKGALNKDIAQLKQKKKEFDPSKIDFSDPQWQETLFPNYSRTLNYLKKKHPDFKISTEAQEAFSHLLETIKHLGEKERIEETEKKEFIVKLWDRDPRKDLFQGNETGCCVAVGVKEAAVGIVITLHPETILQYLVDKGINVAEIVDPETKDVVAQTWLFVTLDKEGKPVLIADNFEVNKRYPVGMNVNRAIREAMFEFLKKYTKACNIEKLGLGMVSTNDVETKDLETLKLPPIEKLGGYLETKNYYLETLTHTKVYEIK